MAELTGKVVLVTGGTSGIGRAAAIAAAAAGAKVVVSGRREAEGAETVSRIAADGGEARFVRADGAIEEEVRALVDATVEAYGRLDAAFNNAGIGIAAPLTEIVEADYQRMFAINVWGVAVAMKYEIRAMLETGGGAIVNTSSIAGHVGFARSSLYTASKHAVEGMTKAAALEFAARDIRINAVAPAFIATPMVERIVGAQGEQRDRLAALHPIARLGRAEEVAAAVLFLLSDASSFVVGESLKVDGGWIAQ